MIQTRHGSFWCWMVFEDERGNIELVLFDEAFESIYDFKPNPQEKEGHENKE